MNTFLKIISLFLAAALPVAFSAETNGVELPAAVDTAHLFAGFVVSLVLLTLFADYRTVKPLRAARPAGSPVAVTASRASLRLAA